MIRDHSGLLAQVHNKIKVEELSGIIGAKKTVVGLTVVKDEVPESNGNVELHIAACTVILVKMSS